MVILSTPRGADNKLHSASVIGQNGGIYGRERSLVWRGKVERSMYHAERRWRNTVYYVVTGNVKIIHLVIVDDSCDVRSIFGSKSVKKQR